MDKPLDVEQSIALANQVKAKNSFERAAKGLSLVEGAVYVQGFVVVVGAPYKPMEHCWLELDDRILDLSFQSLNRTLEQVFYYPAQRLNEKKLKALIEEAQEDYPEDDPLPIYGSEPYAYYGDLMLGGKEYLDAFETATAKARDLNQPKKKIDG
jgi:hypothetical protein